MQKWLVRTSVTLNILVILFMVVLWFAGHKILARVFMEPTHARVISQFELLPVTPGDTVFLGDSITEAGLWEELFPGLPVRNRGIGGDTTEGVLKRLHQVTGGQPAKVFLLIGTNDLGQGIAPSVIDQNINSIVDRIRKESPDTGIYVQSVFPRGESYRDRVEELNTLLETSIPGKAVWIDLYPLLLDESDGSIRNDLSNDELHLFGEGYLLWRDAIESLVRH